MRTYQCDFTVEDFKISGLAAPYDKLSQDMGGFRETIASGAFDDVLANNPSIIACIDHSRDSEKILGSTDSGTLELFATDKGLEFTLDVAKTTAGRDIIELIKRGDINKMSFAFITNDDTWTNYGPETIRTINGFDELTDISIVRTPAYIDTVVS